MTAGILVRFDRRTRELIAPQCRMVVKGRDRHLLQKAGRNADIGNHDLAAQGTARQQEMTGLPAEERHRQIGLESAAKNEPGVSRNA
jgi:hypothetical protein